WFQRDLGVPLKLEDTGKYFPVSDDAQTVLDALLAACTRAGVAVRPGARVGRVGRGGGGGAAGGSGPWGGGGGGRGGGGACAGREWRVGGRLCGRCRRSSPRSGSTRMP